MLMIFRTRQPFSSLAAAFCLAVLSLWANSVSAQSDADLRLDDYETPRAAALGTGARASSASTAALSNNAAAMPLSSVYHIEALTGFSPSSGRWTLGAAVVDSSTSRLAAAMSFRGILSSKSDGYSGYDGRIGLGFPLGEFLSVGLSGRYVSITADAQEGAESGEELVQGFTLDASIVIQPFAGFRVAALANNLILLDSPLTPRLVGGSMSYSMENQLTVGADVLVDTNTNIDGESAPHVLAGGGIEYFAGGAVPIRLGYKYDTGREIHTLSGGLGYLDQHFGVEASLQQDVSGDSETVILISGRYFVQ